MHWKRNRAARWVVKFAVLTLIHGVITVAAVASEQFAGIWLALGGFMTGAAFSLCSVSAAEVAQADERDEEKLRKLLMDAIAALQRFHATREHCPEEFKL